MNLSPSLEKAPSTKTEYPFSRLFRVRYPYLRAEFVMSYDEDGDGIRKRLFLLYSVLSVYGLVPGTVHYSLASGKRRDSLESPRSVLPERDWRTPRIIVQSPLSVVPQRNLRTRRTTTITYTSTIHTPAPTLSYCRRRWSSTSVSVPFSVPHDPATHHISAPTASPIGHRPSSSCLRRRYGASTNFHPAHSPVVSSAVPTRSLVSSPPYLIAESIRSNPHLQSTFSALLCSSHSPVHPLVPPTPFTPSIESQTQPQGFLWSERL